MRKVLVAILAAALTVLGDGAASASSGASVHAEATPDEGRLVFSWDAPTTVRATRSGRKLTLRFDRPFAADLFVPMARLAPWLSNLAAAAGPGEVNLELRDGVSTEVPQAAAATTIVVALRHRPATEQIAPAAGAPSPVPALRIRTGTHPGFGRLVLESDTPLEPDIRRQGDDLLVTTGAFLPQRASTQPLTLSRWLTAATVEGRTLKLRLRPGVAVREERANAAKLVLDFSTPSPRAATPSTASRATGPLAAAVKTDPDTTSVVDHEGAPTPPPTRPEKPAAAPPSGPPHTRVPDAAPHGSPKLPTEVVQPPGEASIATFRWRKPTPAAAFERADVLWIVFGASADDLVGIDAPSLAAAGLRELGRLNLQGLTVFRYLRSRHEPLCATGGGTAWHLQKGEPSSESGKRPATLVARGDGARLVLAATGKLTRLVDPEAGDSLSLILVPEAGPRLDAPLTFVDLEFMPSLAGIVWRAFADDLNAVPGSGRVEFSRPHGLRSAASDLPQAQPAAAATPSAKEARAAEQARDGSALDHHVRPKQAGGAPGEHVARAPAVPGNHHSTLHPAPGAAVEPLALAGIFDRDGPPLATLRRELLGELATLEGDEADAARLRLARLLLADAMGAEALAVLDAALGGPPDGEGEPPKRQAALRAAAELLLGRERRAGELLAAIPGAGDAELALWRAAAAAARQAWDEAARELAGAGKVWADYPPRLRFRLGLAVATVLGQTGRVDPALAVIDQLAGSPATPLDSARLSFVKATLLDRDGRGAAASAALAGAVRDGGFEVGVTARFMGIVSGHERGETSSDEARRRLAEERLLWRGHAWEHRMLDGLAGLEADGGDPVAALGTWQALLSRAPNETTAASTLQRMRKTLGDALAADGPAAVDPVTALALMKTFPTLLPASEAKHRLVGGVAHRLAEAGLPAQAADLLDRHGASAGTRSASGPLDIASYRLAADDAKAALAALTRSEARGEGDGQRLLAEAQALLTLGRPDEALRSLEKQPGTEAAQLRALALWRLKAWSRLREELASDTPRIGSGAENERRVRLAIADARVGGTPAPTGPVEPAADQRSQALLDAISASAPATESARSMADGLPSRVGALRAGLDVVRTER